MVKIGQVRAEQPKLPSGKFSRRVNKLRFYFSVLDISLAEEEMLESLFPFCFLIGKLCLGDSGFCRLTVTEKSSVKVHTLPKMPASKLHLGNIYCFVFL